MKVPLDIEMLDVDDDRPSVRTGERIRGIEKLSDKTGHLFAAERTMNLDGRLTGQRRADFLANAEQVRGTLFDRCVDQKAKKSLDVAPQQLGRHCGHSE